MAIREFARAKVNLTLSVLGRRADGYHALESLVTFADVHDVVTLRPGSAGGVTVAGPFAQYIGGENLLIRAFALCARRTPDCSWAPCGSTSICRWPPAWAADRRMPQRCCGPCAAPTQERVPASLAGHRGAARLRRAGVPWRPAGVHVGHGRAHRARSRVCRGHAVIVNPRVPLSTADVFRELGAAPAAAPSRSRRPAPELLTWAACSTTCARAAMIWNVPLHACCPAIGEIKSALEAQPGCLLAAMSGSGPTCFGIFSDAAEARRAVERSERAQRMVGQGVAGGKPCGLSRLSWPG